MRVLFVVLLFALGCGTTTPADVQSTSNAMGQVQSAVEDLSAATADADPASSAKLEAVAAALAGVQQGLDRMNASIQVSRERLGVSPSGPISSTEYWVGGATALATIVSSIAGAYVLVNSKRDANRKARGEPVTLPADK